MKRDALKKLFHLYNEQGLTSIADRNADRKTLDLYRDLHDTRRTDGARQRGSRASTRSGTREEVARRFDDLPGKDGLGGPTGVGDDWVRVGPIKLFLDGGMLNGSAYMREPWPKGPTYQIDEDGYRGLLFIHPEQLRMVVEEGAKRQLADDGPHRRRRGDGRCCWTPTSSSTARRRSKTSAFASRTPTFRRSRTWSAARRSASAPTCSRPGCGRTATRCKRCWATSAMRWFSPYKTWMEYTTIGGGSDHMVKLDSLEATNPWNPWLAIWATLERQTERGGVLTPDERLTREQAIRLYTINNAYLNARGEGERQSGGRQSSAT